jgi:N-acetylglucosaminyldiphosphoundecaprenol N-acetyl-beta-D-mannosaminyltransferase
MQCITDRLKILDVWVDPVTMSLALNRIESFVEHGSRPRAVFAVNPEKNFSVPKDPVLHDIFRCAGLLIPDGIGVVLAARILHGARLTRVPGVELMEKACELAASRGYGIFLYGAREAVNAKASRVLQERYPGLRIVGRSDGFVKEKDMPTLIERINASGAQILFLALGSPRQEKWFARHAASLTHIRVCQGIGGTLDTIAGTVRRAPAIWCNLNAEWLYRLLKEPKRIMRQRVLPLFVFRVFRSLCNEALKPQRVPSLSRGM